MLTNLAKSPLLKSTAVYAGANVIRQGIPFLFIPIVTRYLTPSDYGKLSIVATLVAIATPIVCLNAPAAMNRRFFDRKELDFSVYVGSTLFIVVASALAFALVVLVSNLLVETISGVPTSWLWAVLLIGTGVSLDRMYLAIRLMSEQALAYAKFQILRTITLTVGILIMVVALHYNWQGHVLAQAIVAILFGLGAIIMLFRGKWMRLSFNTAMAKDILGFGVPLIPHLLFSVINQSIDRFYIAHFRGLQETGLYSVGYQIGAVVLVVQESFHRAWVPWLYVALKNPTEDLKRKLVRSTYGYLSLLLVIAILLGLAAPLAIRLLLPVRYDGSGVFVIWVALGYAFSGMYKTFVAQLFYEKKTAMILFISASGALINIALNTLIVPQHGALGAAYATTITYLLTGILAWALSQRVHPMPWFG